jgi:hypothetical protein
MIILILAGCLLGFVGLVFGFRAFRWTFAFILFLPLFFAALFIYDNIRDNQARTASAAPAAALAMFPTVKPAAPQQPAPTQPQSAGPGYWYYNDNLVDWGPFHTREEAVAYCKAYFIKCEDSRFSTADCAPGSPAQYSSACIYPAGGMRPPSEHDRQAALKRQSSSTPPVDATPRPSSGC